MLNFITRALSENGDANPSTMRVATLLIVVAILTGWLATTLKSGQMQALSSEQVALVLVALAAKGWQRGRENSAIKQSGSA